MANYFKPDEDFNIENRAQLYDKLQKYYDNNSLYANQRYTPDWNSEFGLGIYNKYLRPTRTPVSRSVDFFVSHTAVGDTSKITIKSNNSNLETFIRKIWDNSNLNQKKSLYIRECALFGDLFLKISTDEDKVYFSALNPRFVTYHEEDEFGNLTAIRLDIPIEIEQTATFQTTYWSKTEEYYSAWYNMQGPISKLDELSDPYETHFLQDFGIDFLPFCHIKFKETGSKYGSSCVSSTLSKIDGLNRQTTALENLILKFNKPIFATNSNRVDKEGSVVPAPIVKRITNKIQDGLDAFTNHEHRKNDDDAIFFSMPTMTQIQSLAPNVDFAAALAVIQDLQHNIAQDLPELRYYDLNVGSKMSAEAISLLLAPAMDRVNEFQNNLLSGLELANKQALKIGIVQGIFPATLGTNFEDFDHELSCPDVYGQSVDERASTLQTLTSSGLDPVTAMTIAGFPQDQIDMARTMSAQMTSLAPADTSGSVIGG